MTFNDDGAVTLQWHPESNGDQQTEEWVAPVEMGVEILPEAPL
ncbi:hypothetical protein [Pseudomonas sp. Q1-7]|nr:hypothetical protein [Pseudomonas sp. Q1-7]